MKRFIRLFRRRRVWVGVIFMVCVLVGAFVAINTANAPQSSPVEVVRCVLSDDGACIRFPNVSGQNLAGASFVLPDDFAGDLNLIIMPFTEDQQVRAASWLPMAKQIAAEHTGFAYYDLPTLPAVSPLLRVVVTGGMSIVIPDADLREISIMLFLEDMDLFLATLVIPDRDVTQVFLLDAGGEVVWRTRGDFDAAAGVELQGAVAKFFAP